MSALRSRLSIRTLSRALARLVPRRIRRDERGSAVVEFAFVAFPFVAILGAIMENALLFLSDQILQTAVLESSRLIRTGQATDLRVDGTAMTHEEYDAEVCKRLYILFNCGKLITDVRTYPTFSSLNMTPPLDADGKLTKTGTQFQTGITSGIVVVRAYYPHTLILPNLGLGLANLGADHMLTAVSAFRNEPYPW